MNYEDDNKDRYANQCDENYCGEYFFAHEMKGSHSRSLHEHKRRNRKLGCVLIWSAVASVSATPL
jgi:hypothetical protein